MSRCAPRRTSSTSRSLWRRLGGGIGSVRLITEPYLRATPKTVSGCTPLPSLCSHLSGTRPRPIASAVCQGLVARRDFSGIVAVGGDSDESGSGDGAKEQRRGGVAGKKREF